MECLYCAEDGAVGVAVAICTTCGAAMCQRHAVRLRSSLPYFTMAMPRDNLVRGPLRCVLCAYDYPASPSTRSGGTQAGLSIADVRRLVQGRSTVRDLEVGDGQAAVVAAERLVRAARRPALWSLRAGSLRHLFAKLYAALVRALTLR